MKLILLWALLLLLGFTAKAADVEYKKMGPWSIRKITNADGSLNQCAMHLDGPQGFLRIASRADMKIWTLSIPGSTPSFKLTPGGKAAAFGAIHTPEGGISATLYIFTLDDKAGRASMVIEDEDLQRLRRAPRIDVTLYRGQEACSDCPKRDHGWDLKSTVEAMAAIPACLKNN
jgi:hypothetical protein